MNDNKQVKQMIEAKLDQDLHEEQLRREEKRKEGEATRQDNIRPSSWTDPVIVQLDMSVWGCTGRIQFQHSWAQQDGLGFCRIELLRYNISGADIEGDRSHMGFSAESNVSYWSHDTGRRLKGDGKWHEEYARGGDLVIGWPYIVQIHGRFEFDHNDGWPGAEQKVQLRYPG